ncbi:hypothetical protein UB34_09545 [Photobacterium leiognathi]|nr:hypothetical protein UB34_09545 [Photobacterium leiognathi]
MLGAQTKTVTSSDRFFIVLSCQHRISEKDQMGKIKKSAPIPPPTILSINKVMIQIGTIKIPLNECPYNFIMHFFCS